MNELYVIQKPNSSFAEEIKKVRTNLMFSKVNDDMKAIMITSSLPGEGKSFISSNLAAAFAQANERVLLIDCDLRKGRLKKIFKISPEAKGLSDLLINKDWQTTYTDYIYESDVSNLSVIATGSYPPNPSELLASNRFKKLLSELKKYYDIIILDCPPVIGLNDALVVANIADISVLVADCKKTTMELLEKCKSEFEKVGVKLAGIILNKIETADNNYYYYGHYYKDE